MDISYRNLAFWLAIHYREASLVLKAEKKEEYRKIIEEARKALLE
ncbi:hypothetical protein WKV44_02200 [Spirochaetia bacterium 38H-sp]|uniref:HEPN domain-containing protein n=1 Tax=Rarispira pelagica TaxID=3141764 RepID=A0ABU9U9L1_9SPIR